MSDESFFREVNEEIRHDRTRALWTRFGRALITVAIVAVLATAAFVAWRAYEKSEADESGDRYLAALDLASAGNLTEALSQLEALVQDGHGAYPNLARMRIATVRAAQGDSAAAVAALDAIAGDAGTVQSLRDMAAIRAAYILVDTGTRDEVRARAERLSGDEDAMRFSAREALGLAAWKAGDLAAAKTFFEQIRDGGRAPSGVALRATLMLETIAAGTLPPAAAGPAAAAMPVAPAVSAEPAPAAGTTSAPSAAAPAASDPAPAPSATAPAPSAEATPAPVAEPTPPAATGVAPAPSAPAATAPATAPAETSVPATPAQTPAAAPAPEAEAPPPASTAPAASAPASTAPTDEPASAAPSTPAVPPG